MSMAVVADLFLTAARLITEFRLRTDVAAKATSPSPQNAENDLWTFAGVDSPVRPPSA
jgi:hypothetical protein